ncbi:hypothetical protein DL96DRAFT_1777838 [Flagelloscypha sp. PMI_526]|nr:hypothetical protein DL96DRAFT_1777838 [Flagelloscypha sp. PMI_526]
MSSAGSVAGVPSARNGTPHPGFTSLRYHDPEAYIPLSSKGHKVARPVVEATDSEGDLSEGPSRNHRSTPPPFPSNVKSSHRSRRTSSSTSTSLALSILSDRLNTETNRVTLLSNDLDDQRRAYTLLLAKYGALQTTCSQLQIELDQYKVRFEAQQHEILKAQTVVAQVDRRRRDAEDDVVRGRQKLRQLKAGIAVQDARDGGWKLGFQQGAREAGMVFGGILKNGSSSRRVHEVLDEEAEERRRSRKSTSRGRRSSSRSEVESSGPSRSGTPTSDSRTGLRSGIAEIISRRRSISRLRNRSSSVPGRPLSTVLDGTEPPSSGIPAVPALPPRMSSDQSTPTQAPPHSAPLPTQQQDQSTASLPLRSRAGSDASTRISEFDLVSPPRSGRRPSDSDVGAIPTSSSRPPLPYQPQSTAAEHRPAHQRRHTIDGRPQTSLGMGRPSTPSDRTILGQHSATPKPPPPSAVHHLQVPGARPQSPFMNFIQKRLPLYRNRSSGSVQIAVEPPSFPVSISIDSLADHNSS